MRSLIRTGAFVISALLIILSSACSVRPLLATGPTGHGQSAQTSVAVSPVNTRPALEVRNHLIFLFGGGAGQPANPQYMLDLSVRSRTSSAADIQRGGENEPTAGMVTLTGIYRLQDSSTGEFVSEGQREISANFDRPRQEFATLRAERDAENRAARELAELIRLSVAQDIARLDAR